MASMSKMCSVPDDRRVAPARSASGMGVLPMDVVYDILLRLPAKDLCCLRAVCRQWRLLLSDPAFADDHAACHPEPLIIVGCKYAFFPTEADGDIDPDDEDWKPESIVNILDLSGRIVKRLHFDGHVTSMPLDHVCIKTDEDGGRQLIDPATGVMYPVPKHLAENADKDVSHGLSVHGWTDDLYLVGQVTSTGDYKMLRKVSYTSGCMVDARFELCTLCCCCDEGWRVMCDSPLSVSWGEKTSVVVDGVVYFLSTDKDTYSSLVLDGQEIDDDYWVVSFEFETEMWDASGPLNRFLDNPLDLNNEADGPWEKQVSLANLNGSLVIVQVASTCMDLWFLMDFNKDIWAKQYSIQIEQYVSKSLSFRPLFVLEDERIVIHVGGLQLVEIHDPRTNNFSNVANVAHCSEISAYTGNLLSLDW
ncbi:hypothetical protein EJB05_52442, partial [Eragrostis curvula]